MSSHPESEQDIYTREMLARFGADEHALTMLEETKKIQDSITVERIDNPETNINGIYVVSFPCNLLTLDYVIDVFAGLVKERQLAGFNLFISVNRPYGPGNGLELIMAYRRAQSRVPDIPSITAVDKSQLTGWFFNTLLRSIAFLKTLRMTDITLHDSLDEALVWVRSKQKPTQEITIDKENNE